MGGTEFQPVRNKRQVRELAQIKDPEKHAEVQPFQSGGLTFRPHIVHRFCGQISEIVEMVGNVRAPCFTRDRSRAQIL